MLSKEELDNRFSYHAPTEKQVGVYQDIRTYAKNFARYLTVVCPQSRELALAIGKIEESVFWANAAIARRSDPLDGGGDMPIMAEGENGS